MPPLSRYRQCSSFGLTRKARRRQTKNCRRMTGLAAPLVSVIWSWVWRDIQHPFSANLSPISPSTQPAIFFATLVHDCPFLRREVSGRRKRPVVGGPKIAWLGSEAWRFWKRLMRCTLRSKEAGDDDDADGNNGGCGSRGDGSAGGSGCPEGNGSPSGEEDRSPSAGRVLGLMSCNTRRLGREGEREPKAVKAFRFDMFNFEMMGGEKVYGFSFRVEILLLLTLYEEAALLLYWPWNSW